MLAEQEEEDSRPMKNSSHPDCSPPLLHLLLHLHESSPLLRILILFSCIQAMSKKKKTIMMMNRIPALLLALALVVLLPSASAQTATDNSSSSSSFPLTFSPADVLLINCGASGTGEDLDGRTWKADAGTPSLFSPATTSFQSNAQSDPNSSPPSEVPYATARIFDGETTYRLKVRPGRHFVRLHFYPAWYAGRDPAKALFSVMSGPYSLFRNFSTYITAQADTLQFIMREFSIVVSSAGVLDLKFSPEPPPPGGKSGNSSVSYYYAFVNGIEVISMPDMFVQGQLVGASASFPITDYYAMQTMARANVGGGNIAPAQDSNLSRTWYDDSLYVYGAGGGVQNSADPNSQILYTSSDPGYFAPTEVYATARSMGGDSQFNLDYNLTWLLAIDVNFTYLTRLHFCELVYTKPNQRVFDIYINNQTAMTAVDVIALAEQANPDTPENTPVYLDFVVYVDDSHDDNIWIALHPNTEQKPQYYDAILNGIEIFKLNDSAGNLAGPNPVPQPNFVSPPMSPPPAKAKSSSRGSLIGLIVGAVLACVLVGCIVACCRRKKRYSQIDGASGGWIPLIMNSFSTASKSSTKSGHSSHTVSSAPAGLCRHFTFSELKQVTDNFDESRLLGVGGFGNVYRGVLDGDVEVAVKRGNPQSEQGVNEFQTEIEMLSKLRHKHLVSLIGCCAERDEMILVYDYMGNGTLRSHLYKGDSPPLTWKQRLEICIGAARGLHYLHTGARHTIIHRDVKTTNILLDKNFVAKVSDFGLSKDGPALDHTHVSTVVKGSFGYLDPEYFRRQQLTEKSDVYSFGVVLFEVLCARPALNPALPREQVSLAEWALHCKKKGTLNHIMDPNLKGTINPDSLKKFADIAEKCIADNGVDRPSMGDVLWNLEFALQLHVQTIAMQGNAMDDCVIEMGGDSEKFSSGSSSKEKSMDGQLQGMSVGGKSIESEESGDATPSLLFSQLVNPTGR